MSDFNFYRNYICNIQSVKLNPGQFELAEGEEILKNVKGDYWEKLVVGGEGQNSGEFAFTNKRIAFRSTFQIFGGLNFDIPYNSIVSVEKSNVKGFYPWRSPLKPQMKKIINSPL